MMLGSVRQLLSSSRSFNTRAASRPKRRLRFEDLEARRVLATVVGISGSMEYGVGQLFLQPEDDDEGISECEDAEVITDTVSASSAGNFFNPSAFLNSNGISCHRRAISTSQAGFSGGWVPILGRPDYRFGGGISAEVSDAVGGTTHTATGHVKGSYTVRIQPEGQEEEGDPVSLTIEITGGTNFAEGQGEAETEVRASIGGSELSVTNGGKEQTFDAKIGDQITFYIDSSVSVVNEGSYVTGFSFTADAAEAPPEVIFDVSAQHNALASPDFGPFVDGISLDNKFTVELSGRDGESVDELRFDVDDGPSGTAHKVGDAKFEFTVDVGALGGSAGFELEAYRDGEYLEEFDGLIDSSAFFDLDVLGISGGGSATDITRFRLIEGIDSSLTVEAHVTLDELFDVYQPLVMLAVVDQSDDGVRTAAAALSGSQTNAMLSSNLFSDTVSGSGSDYEFVLLPKGSNNASERVSNGRGLRVASIPEWMGTPNEASFKSESAAISVLGGNTSGAYYFDVAVPSSFQHSLPTTSGTPFGLFDGLETFFGMGATLEVYAAVNLSASAEVMPKEWFVNSKVLGKELLNESSTMDAGFINVDGLSLNVHTLELEGITLTTDTINALDVFSIDKVFYEESFGKTGKKWRFPGPVPGTELGIEGDVKAEWKKLRLKAGLGIDFSDPSDPQFVEETTFVQLDAKATGLVKLEGSVIFTALGFDIASAGIGVAALVKLDSLLKVNFSGDVDSPSLHFPSDDSFATLFAGYRTFWDLEALKQKVAGREISEDKFDDLKEFKLFGTTKDVLKPTDLNKVTMTVPTPIPPSSQPAEGEAPLIPSITEVLPGSVDYRFRTLSFDLTLHSLTQTLTPDTHRLEVLLVNETDGSEILLGTFDLADQAMVAGDSLLGFGSSSNESVSLSSERSLEFGADHQVALRLTSDESGGEVVAITVENVQLGEAQPQLVIESQFGSLTDQSFDFGADTNGTDTGTIAISNVGVGGIEINSAEIIGDGFSLQSLPTFPVGLFNGGQPLIFDVLALDGSAPAEAVLRLTTDDTNAPHVELTLRRDAVVASAASIRVRQFRDANANGQRDEGEAWQQLRMFELLDAEGNVLRQLETDRSDDNGDFEYDSETEHGIVVFDDLSPGPFRLRQSLPDGETETAGTSETINVAAGEVLEFIFGSQVSDFGDAPTAEQSGLPVDYPTLLPDGARHAIGSGLFLGASVENDADGQPELLAYGDDCDTADCGQSDEDGVIPLASILSTDDAITKSSFLVTASAPGKLDAWVDFDRDGEWDDSEQVMATSVDVHTGPNLIELAVPANMATGDTFARFRVSSAGNLAPHGPARDGEVEDYRIKITESGDTAIAQVDLVPALGNALFSIDAGELVVSSPQGELFRASDAAFANLDITWSESGNKIGLASLHALSNGKLRLRGTGGTATVSVEAENLDLDLTAIDDASLRAIGRIEVIGNGANTLTLTSDEVIATTDESKTLRVVTDRSDTIALEEGWTLTTRVENEAVFLHVLSKDEATLEIDSEADWTNPRSLLDTSGNGSIEPLDVLLVINELISPEFSVAGELLNPASLESFPNFFFDTTKDGFVSPLDALLVINFLNAPRDTAENEQFVIPEPTPPISESSISLRIPQTLSLNRPNSASVRKLWNDADEATTAIQTSRGTRYWTDDNRTPTSGDLIDKALFELLFEDDWMIDTPFD